MESTHVSPDGRVKAVVTAAARTGRYESRRETAWVAVTVPGRRPVEFELFAGYPVQVIVLDDGRLVTLGRGCCPEDRMERLIAVFDAGGEPVFDAGLHELVRVASPAVQLSGSTDGDWFREALWADDRVLVVLKDYNRLLLSLDQLTLTYVTVADEELTDAELRARGLAWLGSPRRDEGVAILEHLVQRIPADREAASHLARSQRQYGEHRAAIETLLRVVDDNPLTAHDGFMPCSDPTQPFGMRCALARTYLGAGEPAVALRLIESIRPYGNPDADLDLLAIEALLALERVDDADGLAEELIAREREGPSARWHTRRIQHLYEQQGLIERGVDVLARAGANGNDPKLLEERARGLVRAGHEGSAVPILHALIETGRQAVAATLLGDIHASDSGDVPMDLAAARRWYAAAAEAPDSESSGARFEMDRVRWRLCALSLVAWSRDGRDAARWCTALAEGEPGLYRNDGVFWAGIVHLDTAFEGADAERGLALLASDHCPSLGIDDDMFFRAENAKALYGWAVETLEGYLDRDLALVELCLGRLLARGEGPASPPFRPDRARELLTAAADRGSGEALLSLAQLEKRHCCTGACGEEVRSLYERAADKGEAWAHYYLAEIIVEDGADTELPDAIRHLEAFSTLETEANHDLYCRLAPGNWGRHSAERLYQALEARLGRSVERTLDRGCEV